MRDFHLPTKEESYTVALYCQTLREAFNGIVVTKHNRVYFYR